MPGKSGSTRGAKGTNRLTKIHQRPRQFVSGTGKKTEEEPEAQLDCPESTQLQEHGKGHSYIDGQYSGLVRIEMN
jgi:hypothetical protein